MSRSRKPLSQHIALALARLLGWQIEVPPSVPAKCLIIGAHHTSGSDFFVTMLYLFASNLRFRWIAKDSAFRWPFGWLMRRLGGIPVVRSARSNFVDQIVALYDASDRLRVAISPEGTRSESGYWKTGFYYIAQGAGVPILHVYGDADELVPWEENTGVVQERYAVLGGEMATIVKPGGGHHPHGPEDPTPVVEWIEAHFSQ